MDVIAYIGPVFCLCYFLLHRTVCPQWCIKAIIMKIVSIKSFQCCYHAGMWPPCKSCVVTALKLPGSPHPRAISPLPGWQGSSTKPTIPVSAACFPPKGVFGSMVSPPSSAIATYVCWCVCIFSTAGTRASSQGSKRALSRTLPWRRHVTGEQSDIFK